jgi:hypothetical protein
MAPMHFFFSYRKTLLRLAAALIAPICLMLTFTAGASALTICSNGSTSWTGGSGSWNDDSHWTNGVPSQTCAASITAAGTYTVTLTPYGANGDSQSGDNVSSMALGGSSGTQTLYIEGEGSISNSNETNNLTELGVSGVMNIGANGKVILDSTANNNGNGGPNGGAATLDVAQPSTNAGTIVSQVEDTQWHNTILGQLANTGTLDVNSGMLGFNGSSFTGAAMTVSNSGSFAVASGASVEMVAGDGSTFTNSGGTYANNGTTTLTGSMYWVQSGGAETGNPINITGGETLQDSAGAGSFEYSNCGFGGGGLIGTIPQGQTVTVQGVTLNCSGNVGQLSVLSLGNSKSPGPVINDGTLVLNAPGSGTTSGGGAQVQGSELDNHGTLDATVTDTKFAATVSVPLVNEAGATVNLTGGQLDQTAGTATTNNGTVNIGPGATWLVQGGSFTNTGTIGLGIASATSLGTFNLTVSSKFNAGGTLAPALASGYVPAAGTEFPIVTENGGSPSGTFGSVTGGFSADYTKETASPGYLGIVYGGAAGTGGTTTTSVVRPAVKKISGGAGKLVFKLSCAKTAKSACSYTLSGTVGKKKVASGHGTIKPGKSVTVTLKLNKAGLALLKKKHRLRVKVMVSAGGKTIKTSTVTVTKAAASKKKK